MRDPEANRQDAIEAACHNALRAGAQEIEDARREHRSFDDRLALALVLEAIERERTADLPDVAAPFTYRDVIGYLRSRAGMRPQP